MMTHLRDALTLQVAAVVNDAAGRLFASVDEENNFSLRMTVPEKWRRIMYFTREQPIHVTPSNISKVSPSLLDKLWLDVLATHAHLYAEHASGSREPLRSVTCIFCDTTELLFVADVGCVAVADMMACVGDQLGTREWQPYRLHAALDEGGVCAKRAAQSYVAGESQERVYRQVT